MVDPVIRSYRDLRVWREAMELVGQCYRHAASWPKDELYGLTSQLRRAAVSVAANIAEGYGRDYTGDYIRHLKIAQGSLKEVETLLLVAEKVEITSPGNSAGLLAQSDAVGRMLNGLIRSLEKENG